MRKLFITVFVIALCAVPGFSQGQDAAAAAKNQAKAEKRARELHLKSTPQIAIAGANLDAVGQALTMQLAREGFTLAESETPPFNATYRVLYVRPVTDSATELNMRVWVGLNFGIRSNGQGAVNYFLAFDINKTAEGVALVGRYGLLTMTRFGVAARDMSDRSEFRDYLDHVMIKVKHSVESQP